MLALVPTGPSGPRRRQGEGGPNPVVLDPVASLAYAIPQPDREPAVEQMQQAMNGGDQAAEQLLDKDAGGA